MTNTSKYNRTISRSKSPAVLQLIRMFITLTISFILLSSGEIFHIPKHQFLLSSAQAFQTRPHIVPTTRTKPILHSTNPQTKVTFLSPLLSEGYPPTVTEYTQNRLATKPILLYLPGFDGTIVAPFLQFPELSTIFDVRGMTVRMNDRSTFLDLKREVLSFLSQFATDNREIYLAGESFGGILACEIAATSSPNIKGLVLINPATCYLQSALHRYGPEVLQSMIPFVYPFAVFVKLVPLFLDRWQFPQLLLILTSRALPSVIDTPEREAYMGRVALSLGEKLQFMPRKTLEWRLDQWLTRGCDEVRLDDLAEKRLKTLIVVGEDDKTLPSLDEAERLHRLFPDCYVKIVLGAGHASTCGSRVDLAAEIRNVFSELAIDGGRTEMKEVARNGKDEFFGMEPRYDGNTNVGMSPLRYWDEDVYRKWKDDGEDDSS